MITVIGAGSGKAENLSLDAFRTIKKASKVVLKTEKMPIKRLLEDENIPFETLDGIYEQAEDFDALNAQIKDYLLSSGDCVYVVHGSALDDTSVRSLGKVNIIPGISVADCAAAYMNLPKDIKAYTSTEVLSGTLPSVHTDCMVTCIDSLLIAGDIKCILADIYGDEAEISFYTEDYDGNQSFKEILLYQLDMQDTYNHTTSIFLKSRF